MTVRPLALFKSSNFAPAFMFLPAGRRRALKAVYAFCRVVDDAVDVEVQRAAEDKSPDFAKARETIEQWRRLLRNVHTEEPGPRVDRAVWAALEETLRDHPIRTEHLLGLIDGVARDLTQTRYATFEDTKAYCYGVASTVGLACLPIFRIDEPTHKDFAVNLGYAVQLTNILRDVGVDAARDRIYLPQEDLKRFGVSDEQLKRGVHNADFVRLMRFECSRAEEFYALAKRSLPPMSRAAARPALVMGEVYRALLDEIRRNGFDVFSRRARLSPWRKLRSVGSVVWNEWTDR